MTERAHGFWWAKVYGWTVVHVGGHDIVGDGEWVRPIDSPDIEWGEYIGTAPGEVRAKERKRIATWVREHLTDTGIETMTIRRTVHAVAAAIEAMGDEP